MNKYLTNRMLRRLLKNSTFTDEQAKKFTEYMTRFMQTSKGTFAIENYSKDDFVEELTDWIAEEPDYDDEFWKASKPKKKKKGRFR